MMTHDYSSTITHSKFKMTHLKSIFSAFIESWSSQSDKPTVWCSGTVVVSVIGIGFVYVTGSYIIASLNIVTLYQPWLLSDWSYHGGYVGSICEYVTIGYVDTCWIFGFRDFDFFDLDFFFFLFWFWIPRCSPSGWCNKGDNDVGDGTSTKGISTLYPSFWSKLAKVLNECISH